MKHRNENWPAQFPGRMSQEATKPWCAIAPHLAPNQTFWVRSCLTQNFNQILRLRLQLRFTSASRGKNKTPQNTIGYVRA